MSRKQQQPQSFDRKVLMIGFITLFTSCCLVHAATVTDNNHVSDHHLNNNDERLLLSDVVRVQDIVNKNHQYISTNKKDSVFRLANEPKTLDGYELSLQLEQYYLNRTTTTSNEKTALAQVDRDLQIDIGTILEIISNACGLVGTLLLFEDTVICDCEFGSLQLDFTCDFQSEICVGPLCSIPTVSGGFNIVQTNVDLSYCTNGGTFNDATIPNLCVSVSGDLVPAQSAVTGTSSETTAVTSEVVSEDGSILEKMQFLRSIRVTLDGKECRSSSICDNGQGYMFDCTNVNKKIKQSVCTPIQTLISLRQAPGTVSFLPVLDNPVPTKTPTKAPTIAPTITPTTAPIRIKTFVELFSEFQKLFSQLPSTTSTTPTNGKKNP